MKFDNSNTHNVCENGAFMTASPGVYKFYALYNNHKNKCINITASAGECPIEYKRHIAVFKFTGTWCTFCPTGGTQIDFWLEKPKYSTGHVLAFHGGSDKEPMLIPETDYLFTQVIKFSGGYPAASIDMRDKAETSSMTSDVKTGLDRSLNEFPAYFSVNISSKINMEKTKAEVSVSVNSSVTETYNVVLYVVENGLIYEQLSLGYYDPTYRHDHVVRKLISQTVFGSSMGLIAAGTEA